MRSRPRPGTPAVVRAWRGPLVECFHRVSCAVSTPRGKIVAEAGDPDRLMILRSTAKPFQVQALLLAEQEGAEATGSEELALACASHDATPRHVALVGAWLDRLGLAPGDLGCGPHPPLGEAAAHALIRASVEPARIHNNCSGKHTAMLASCVARGWPTAGYLDPRHPLQKQIRMILHGLSGQLFLIPCVDGCGAPTYGLPLSGVARMAAQLAAPDQAPSELRPGLERAFAAMRAHPELVGGDDVLDTVLMRCLDGVVAKRGADGGYLMALRDSRLGPVGVALKVEDGSDAPRPPAVLKVLDGLGLDASSHPELAALAAPVRRNTNGFEVGRYTADFELAML